MKPESEFTNAFKTLLSDELKQQGFNDTEIQTKISAIANDEEFIDLMKMHQSENTSYLADTTEELTQNSDELKKIIDEQGKLSDAIYQYDEQNSYLQRTYFEPAKIPATTYAPPGAGAPTPTSEVSQAPTTPGFKEPE